MNNRFEYAQRVLSRIPEELRDIPIQGECGGLTPREFAADFDERSRESQPHCPACLYLFMSLAVWQPWEVWGAA